MEQKDKELLLRYLCMALPYGVILDHSFIVDKQRIHTKMLLTYRNIGTIALDEWHTNEEIFKPYLRPLSSMTEEEEKEFNCQMYKAKPYSDGKSYNFYEVIGLDIIYLNVHHFDYFGLIPKGLAIAITEDNNPYKIVEEQI